MPKVTSSPDFTPITPFAAGVAAPARLAEVHRPPIDRKSPGALLGGVASLNGVANGRIFGGQEIAKAGGQRAVSAQHQALRQLQDPPMFQHQLQSLQQQVHQFQKNQFQHLKQGPAMPAPVAADSHLRGREAHQLIVPEQKLSDAVGRQPPLPQKPSADVHAASPAQTPAQFASRMKVDYKEQERIGGELQTLRYNDKYSLGVVTRYPETEEDVEAMLLRALSCPDRKVVNLMKRGDMDIDQSYVDQIPEGESLQIGRLQVAKSKSVVSELGPNADGDPTTLEKTRLFINDPMHPEKGWQKLKHLHVDNWLDTTAPPDDTFEKTWRSVHVPGPRGKQAFLTHCAGGVGRTACVVMRDGFEHHLEAENKRHHRVTRKEAEDFMTAAIQQARSVRGSQFMADEKQLEMLMRSVYRGVDEQTVPRPAKA